MMLTSKSMKEVAKELEQFLKNYTDSFVHEYNNNVRMKITHDVVESWFKHCVLEGYAYGFDRGYNKRENGEDSDILEPVP